MLNSIYKIAKTQPFIILLLIFVFLSTLKINNVGIFYDELLHAVSSQKLSVGDTYFAEVPSVANKHFFGRTFPLMILYYVGPLKTYALLPFLQLNQEVIDPVRIFSISAAVLTITLTYIFCQINFSIKVAILTTLFLVLDPSFLFAASFDWGPTSIQNILKLLVLISLFKILKTTKNNFYYYLFSASSSLLIWDKLNSLWLLFPVWLIALFYIVKNKAAIPTQTLIKSFIFAIIFLSPFIIFVIKKPFFYAESTKSFNDFELYLKNSATNLNITNLLTNYSSNYFDKLTTLNNTINGSAIPNHILTKPINGSAQSFIVLVAFAIYPITRIIKLQRDRQFKLSNLDLIYSLAVIITLAAVFTPHANGPHHFLLLWPLHLILISVFLAKLHESKPKLVILLISLILLSNLQVIYQFKSKSDNQENIKTYWKKGTLEQLTKYLNAKSGKIIALDWGISLPVAYHSQGNINIEDLQPFYRADCKKLDQLINKQKARLVTYDNSNIVFPEYYTQCQETLSTFAVESVSIFKLYSKK